MKLGEAAQDVQVWPALLDEKRIKLNLSGNELYHTACSVLVILKNLCSKLHSQTGFNFILFSLKISPRQLLEVDTRECARFTAH
jgi:hypothetical protein